jgi:hypothetical protein
MRLGTQSWLSGTAGLHDQQEIVNGVNDMFVHRIAPGLVCHGPQHVRACQSSDGPGAAAPLCRWHPQAQCPACKSAETIAHSVQRSFEGKQTNNVLHGMYHRVREGQTCTAFNDAAMSKRVTHLPCESSRMPVILHSAARSMPACCRSANGAPLLFASSISRCICCCSPGILLVW